MENTDIKNIIISKIEEYKRIIITRHLHPDGDATGSSHGLAEILRASYPDKEIYVIGRDTSEETSFAATDDTDIDKELYRDALAIITDTGSLDRAANENIGLCRETVKIDHHIIDKPYGNYVLVDDKCSSTCEIIAELCYSFPDKLKITKKAASLLYMGIITDTDRFRFAPSSKTFYYAGKLLDEGVDAVSLYTTLAIRDKEYYEKRAELQRDVKYTENGVAYLILPFSRQKELGLSRDEASAMLSLMDSIKGSPVWIAIIENEEGGWRGRLRSRQIPIRDLAAKYRGGGHIFASGATLEDESEIPLILSDADKILAEYKSSHKECL